MFKKGESGNIKGKPKGTPNKLTRTVKETVLAVFDDLQQDPKANLLSWGKGNPTEFYKIAAKLIPTEIAAKVEINKPIIIDWSENKIDISNPTE
jgi:Family of unknown function (DUF5681)